MDQVLRGRVVVLFLIFLVGCAGPLPILGEVPPFILHNQQGQEVRREDFQGKVWIADFIYTGCGDICPMLSQKMGELQKRVGTIPQKEVVRLVSFSVDPKNDTPARLALYAERFSAEAGRWLFLTGDLEEVQRTVEEGFKISMKKGDDFQIFHGDRLVLVDRRGRIRGYYEPSEKGMKDLIQGVKGLVGEK